MKNKLTKKTFSHRYYKQYAGRYVVESSGNVFDTTKKQYLKIHLSHNRLRFVRLAGKHGLWLSIGLAKLMLLTFKGDEYKNGLIAIHKDGHPSVSSLDNLQWGTRKTQAAIAMKDKKYRTRIRNMGRKYGKLNWRKNLITDGSFLKKWRENNKKQLS